MEKMFSVTLQFLILFVILAMSCLSCSNAEHTMGDSDIGTALFISREGKETWSTDTGRVVNSFERKGASVRKLGQHFTKDSSPNSFWKTFSRSLKYSACSETQNSISSIVQCSNAVRKDPDLFVNDYPCSYNSWRNEVSGRTLVALQTGPIIMRLAQLHTDDQARMNTMTHAGSDGSDLQTRADRISLPWGTVGENVAVGFSSAKAVVMAWMCSPPHRKNLMSCDFSTIGVGAGVSSAGRNFYTQVFSCGISEDCVCGSKGGSSRQQRKKQSSGGQPQLPLQKSQSDTSCSWVNGRWTCVKKSSTSTQQHYNPYGY